MISLFSPEPLNVIVYFGASTVELLLLLLLLQPTKPITERVKIDKDNKFFFMETSLLNFISNNEKNEHESFIQFDSC